MFFAGQVLETVTQDFRAHDHDRAGADRGLHRRRSFKTYVCNQIPALFTCANLYVDVQSYPAFSSVTINSQIDASNNFVTNMQYSPGSPATSSWCGCSINGRCSSPGSATTFRI